jgi:hypothetical protein
MLEELKKLQEEMSKAREEAFEKYEKMYDEYCNKILEFLPYMNKIIKVQGFYGYPLYINVREIFRHGDKIVIRGYGFSSEFTEYADATWANWDFMTSHEFRIESIESEIKNITIINEVEFNRSFDQLINNMRYEHMKKML